MNKKRKISRNTRKNILASVYFVGGIILCYYSFKKILWFCLIGLNTSSIISLLILVVIFVISCFAIGEAEYYYIKKKEKKEKRE